MRGEQTEQVLKYKNADFGQIIANIDVSAKERIKAAELIGKRYSMWTEKLEVQSENVVIVDDID